MRIPLAWIDTACPHSPTARPPAGTPSLATLRPSAGDEDFESAVQLFPIPRLLSARDGGVLCSFASLSLGLAARGELRFLHGLRACIYPHPRGHHRRRLPGGAP